MKNKLFQIKKKLREINSSIIEEPYYYEKFLDTIVEIVDSVWLREIHRISSEYYESGNPEGIKDYLESILDLIKRYKSNNKVFPIESILDGVGILRLINDYNRVYSLIQNLIFSIPDEDSTTLRVFIKNIISEYRKSRSIKKSKVSSRLKILNVNVLQYLEQLHSINISESGADEIEADYLNDQKFRSISTGISRLYVHRMMKK
nr:hypothetical protein [Leptospira interrogans]